MTRARRGPAVAAMLSVALSIPAVAAAQNSQFRLQGSEYVGVQPGMALLVVHGSEDVNGWASADALVWGGIRNFNVDHGSDPEGVADVLIISVRLADPNGHAEGRIGRFIVSPGALRPVHMDGADVLVRIPGDFRLEAFGGVPVQPDFGWQSYDWLVGGRLSRAIGDWGSVGVAYLHQRDHGALSDQEIGVDVGAAAAKWLDVSGRMSYDLVNPGVSEILGMLALHHSVWRTELFYKERSPSRILPATSLFSVLGDVASRDGGAHVDCRVAPRLNLSGTAAVRAIGSKLGESLRLKGRLLLDDQGKGAVSLEGRRESAPDANWTGLRAAAKVPIAANFAASTEVEIVIPDHPHGQGNVWPWGLVGLEWQPTKHWEVAGAVLASASPQFQRRVDGLLRVTYRLEAP